MSTICNVGVKNSGIQIMISVISKAVNLVGPLILVSIRSATNYKLITLERTFAL